jgi:hypothetical protein
MHDPHTSTSLEGLRIYDGDELIFDGSDPTTCVVCKTAADIAAALADTPTTEDRGACQARTIADGGAPRCEDCAKMPKFDVYRSAAGFYVGTYCDCGPYTRESGYYLTRELAQADLNTGAYGR